MLRLVLIDGHAILYRAYHALPPLTTKKGEPINAVYGFASMLLRIIDNLQPTHLIVTFDRPTPTFRNEIFKQYQAQRPEMEKDLVSQVDLTRKMVEEMEIPIYEMDGYEADDLMGTIAHKTKKGFETIIVTGDRDLLQLVNDKVKIYVPVKGLSESKMFGKLQVKEKYGIKPEQIVDYKALIGDPSDNYPGVEGIGPKTASGLLNQYKTLGGIYKHIDSIKRKSVREKLVKGKESAYLSKKLAQIVENAPIKLDLDKCRLPQLDSPDILSLFDVLGFRSLIPRLSGSKRKLDSPVGKEQKTDKNKHQQTTIF